MSKVILSGYYGFDNFGDEAILQVLVNNLKNINAEITVLSHNPKKTSKLHDVKSVFMFNLFKVFNSIKNSDVLISGGGSLLQDATSARSIFYYLFIIFLGILFCKRVIIFAQGIGPVNGKLAKSVTKYLLKKVDLITVRDERSKKLLESWDINAKQIEDPVWGINIKRTFPKNSVGIQLREWKYMPDEFFLNLVRQVAKDFADREICIFSFQDKQDYEICSRFEYYLHLENPQVKTRIYRNMNVNEIIEKMAGLEYLIAMRYHAIMLGAKYGSKILAINYDPKVETISNMLKIPCINFDDSKNIGSFFEKLQALSRRSILLAASKKRFSFELFEDEINSEF